MTDCLEKKESVISVTGVREEECEPIVCERFSLCVSQWGTSVTWTGR